MSYFAVDVESDGQIPGLFSMVSFGAVMVSDLSKTFYGKVRPISEDWKPEDLAISGHTREEHLTFDDPKEVMENFAEWIKENTKGQPVFISDNNGYDWSFVNWYFHYFLGYNPFGWSSKNLNSLYHGCVRDTHKSFKHLRKTKHTHHPVDDAMGNAEVLIAMKEKFNLKINL